MRFRKLNPGVELPEKSSPELYINIRSDKRVDIRSNESVAIATGIEISVAKDELATISGPHVITHVIEPCKYTELFVMVRNSSDRLMMIYPGQVLAGITVARKAKASKPKKKKTTIKTKAVLLPNEEAPPGEAWHHLPPTTE